MNSLSGSITVQLGEKYLMEGKFCSTLLFLYSSCLPVFRLSIVVFILVMVSMLYHMFVQLNIGLPSMSTPF